ncbi:T9SS type A sorting domain-containing protein [Niastella populi]|uniref:Secretion system C-terminal sorting domain-containing protein n=1 Tax=Niastella populi TaxID=550983 RepID=A0A1V9G697_9BACT|nr:T9SS type A sorting domain-containing protein [Niastella populi]OQP66151.1 hypothetical protein A4R26_13745 [Niastella populi]
MKYIHSLFLFIAALTGSQVSAQCTGGCPAGAIALPTSSATLATGSTYCISTTTNLSGNTYSINGTLVVQAGTVTLGSVTLNKTGVILVKFGAKLVITGILTGNNTAPVSAIDNIIVCNGGLLDITGSFSQGLINIAINDFGIMKVTGAWTSSSTATNVKIGTGSLIELCSSFNMNKNGFFTETGTGTSYLVTHGGMQQSVTNGFLSSLQNASQIRWTSTAPAAFVSHPAALTCNACGSYALAPTGTNGTCGSAANALNNTVLITRPGGTTPPQEIINRTAIYPNPAKNHFYLQLPRGHVYTAISIYNALGQQVHRTTVQAGPPPVRYNLPVQLPPALYFVQLTGSEKSLTLRLATN